LEHKNVNKAVLEFLLRKQKKNILLTLHFFHLSILANQLLQHQNKSVASSPKYFRGLALQKAL
jgi:hypothetical protein